MGLRTSSYSREGSGFLGYEDCISPIISAGSPETHWPTGTGSSSQERKNLTFGSQKLMWTSRLFKNLRSAGFPPGVFFSQISGVSRHVGRRGGFVVLGNPLSRWISWDFLLGSNTWKPKHCWKTKRDPCNILSTEKLRIHGDGIFTYTNTIKLNHSRN